jgi:hypothetical protein
MQTDIIRLGKTRPASDTILLGGNPTMAFRVHGNLWIGNAPQMGSLINMYFRALVLCANGYQPDSRLFGNGVQVIHAPMDDDYNYMSKDDMATAVRAGGCTARFLREGKPTLVTCMMGRNRSGLVCALALCVGPARMQLDEAIATVRAARGPEALQNPQFHIFLKDYMNHIISSKTELSLQTG